MVVRIIAGVILFPHPISWLVFVIIFLPFSIVRYFASLEATVIILKIIELPDYQWYHRESCLLILFEVIAKVLSDICFWR